MDKAVATADRWCILRTAGPRTLPLARSLEAAGFSIWTPRRTEKKRRSRGKKSMVDVELAITPTFVFARAQHIPELARVRELPSNPHPAFSIFRHGGRIPLVADREIANLRAAEEKARVEVLKTKRHAFPVGGKVRVPDGPFAGLTGIVEGGDGKQAMVSFGGGFQVKIATWLLRTDEVQSASAEPGAKPASAALAA